MSGNWYNGFSPADRTKGANLLRRALREGTVLPASICSMCGRVPSGLGYHNEDYRKPLTAYPICRRCHYAIHIRFRRPYYWREFIAPLDRNGWFQNLTPDPASLYRPYDLTYPEGGTAHSLLTGGSYATCRQSVAHNLAYLFSPMPFQIEVAGE
ncbi:hypothetical protein [Sphingomonas sp. IW22]|uniref:hypothetical protein n=1 Tax=Sphingomonas sp. IW22 TaxID=3242489 RepID=UPI00351FC6A8